MFLVTDSQDNQIFHNEMLMEGKGIKCFGTAPSCDPLTRSTTISAFFAIYHF